MTSNLTTYKLNGKHQTSGKSEERILVRLLPEEVSNSWDFFAPLIQRSLPPDTSAGQQEMVNVLRAILMEQLVCWALYKEEELIFVLCTHVRLDQISLARSLLIYAFTAVTHVTTGDFSFTLERISDYARSQGCFSISAFVANSRVGQYLRSIGFSGQYEFISLEV